MNDFLKKIIEHKKKVNKDKQAYYRTVRGNLDGSTYNRYHLFQRQISALGQINLIAEIKKASPSKGMIQEDFDIMAIGKAYADSQVAAISVLTEDKYFLGKPEFVRMVSDEFKVPVLTKDFILEEGQIYEACVHGASAILLIVNILTDDQLRSLRECAQKLDMDCLVEVHDEEELHRAIDSGAEIIGVNNRDLHTFEVDIKTAEKLIPRIPEGIIRVAESGITSHDDIKRLKDAGAHAVLIGETFMKADDIRSKIKEVMYGEN